MKLDFPAPFDPIKMFILFNLKLSKAQMLLKPETDNFVNLAFIIPLKLAITQY